jgi:hypothetical protein
VRKSAAGQNVSVRFENGDSEVLQLPDEDVTVLDGSATAVRDVPAHARFSPLELVGFAFFERFPAFGFHKGIVRAVDAASSKQPRAEIFWPESNEVTFKTLPRTRALLAKAPACARETHSLAPDES